MSSQPYAKVAIYQGDDGVGKVVSTHQAEVDRFGEGRVFSAAVPALKPYEIVDMSVIENLHKDYGSYRKAWVFEIDNPSGVGSHENTPSKVR